MQNTPSKPNRKPIRKRNRVIRLPFSRLGVFLLTLFSILLTVTLSVSLFLVFSPPRGEGQEQEGEASTELDSAQEEKIKWEEELPDFITVDLIRVDGESRRGEALEAVRDIAVHYVGNPNTTAKANRNYFDSEDSETSSHFIVGLEGEILLCVPLNEKSSATNERNRDTISIEVCHPDETGEFSSVTREALVRLLAYLLDRYDLDEKNIIRHYDVTGKECPLYYVKNEDAWEELKRDALAAREEIDP